MTWTVSNRGNSPMTFEIALAASVATRVSGTTATLSRRDIQLRVEGIADIEQGGRISAKVPPHETISLHWALTSLTGILLVPFSRRSNVAARSPDPAPLLPCDIAGKLQGFAGNHPHGNPMIFPIPGIT